MRGTHT